MTNSIRRGVVASLQRNGEAWNTSQALALAVQSDLRTTNLCVGGGTSGRVDETSGETCDSRGDGAQESEPS